MIARRRGIARRTVGLAAGTAVMAGTAGAVHRRQEQRWAAQDAAAYEQMAQQEELEQLRAQQAAPAPTAAPAQPGSDLTSKLQQLAQLHDAGVLNDEEFAQAKAKLLSGG